jgi:hypothetical protein
LNYENWHRPDFVYTPQYFLDLKTLAEARGIDPDKFYTGIGQEKMGVPPPDEDIVTMGASAAFRLTPTQTGRPPTDLRQTACSMKARRATGLKT